MAKKKIPQNIPTEQHRFEILLEEIRGQLMLVCEAQQASVERDAKLDAKMDRMHREFYQFVSNVHAELSGRIDRLSGRIDGVQNELNARIDTLSEQINEVKEILIAHDKRIVTLEHT